MDNIEEYDIGQAQKLLDNIRHIADLRKFQVPKPFTVLDQINMAEWVKWYVENIEWNGSMGVEKEVLHVIHKIDEHLQIISSRAEEGYRKLLMVLDRRNQVVKQLQDQLIESENKLLDAQSHQVFSMPAGHLPPGQTEGNGEMLNEEIDDPDDEEEVDPKQAIKDKMKAIDEEEARAAAERKRKWEEKKKKKSSAD